MSAGPTSPPPCAWQPTQLKALYSACPCVSCQALSPYSWVCCARNAGSVAPASSGVIAVCDGGLVASAGLENSRCSRSQPAASSQTSRAAGAKLLRQREDIQHSSTRALFLELAFHVAEALVR